MTLIEHKDDTEHYFEDETGNRQCEYKNWWDNGQFWEHSHYIDDKLQGEYKNWWDNGPN